MPPEFPRGAQLTLEVVGHGSQLKRDVGAGTAGPLPTSLPLSPAGPREQDHGAVPGDVALPQS